MYGCNLWSQLSKIVYGAEDVKGVQKAGLKPHPKATIYGGIMADKSAALLRDFLKKKKIKKPPQNGGNCSVVMYIVIAGNLRSLLTFFPSSSTYSTLSPSWVLYQGLKRERTSSEVSSLVIKP